MNRRPQGYEPCELLLLHPATMTTSYHEHPQNNIAKTLQNSCNFIAILHNGLFLLYDGGMNNFRYSYKQSAFGQHTQTELRQIYDSLSDDTREIIDAKARAVALEMNKRGQSFSQSMALELILSTVAYLEDPTLAIPAK